MADDAHIPVNQLARRRTEKQLAHQGHRRLIFYRRFRDHQQGQGRIQDGFPDLIPELIFPPHVLRAGQQPFHHRIHVGQRPQRLEQIQVMRALGAQHGQFPVVLRGQPLNLLHRVILLRVKDEQTGLRLRNQLRLDATQQGGLATAGCTDDQQMLQQIRFVQPDVTSGRFIYGQMQERFFAVHI